MEHFTSLYAQRQASCLCEMAIENKKLSRIRFCVFVALVISQFILVPSSFAIHRPTGLRET